VEKNAPDICVKAVGSEAMQGISATADARYQPSWSPDGREIAFVRYQQPNPGIYIASWPNGSERKISSSGSSVVWTPDGKSVLIRDRVGDESNAVFELSLETEKRRQLTRPAAGDGDRSFDISPDGRTLALVRNIHRGIGDIYVMPMSGGEPKRLTDWNGAVRQVAWMPDGKELIYSVDGRLWRISPRLAKPGRGSPVADIPMSVDTFSIARRSADRRVRLVFSTSSQSRVGMARVDLTSAVSGGVFQTILAFAPATRKDIPGRFSPSGARTSFVSNRASTNWELWVANGDGSRPRQATSFGEAGRMLAGSWSPDGARIVFDADIQGNTDLYVVSADGGTATRLTTNPRIETLPEWSHDGSWIYYASAAKGNEFNIWRMPAAGGTAEQITTEGGYDPQESPDGKYLYYVDRWPPYRDGSPIAGRLMRIPTGGGKPEVIRDNMLPFWWSVADNGLYFIQAPEGELQSIHLYRFEDRRTIRIGAIPFRIAWVDIPGRLSVSRDGRWALISMEPKPESDLMLLDNFR
jgi:Tol biopolymer transport system component